MVGIVNDVTTSGAGTTNVLNLAHPVDTPANPGGAGDLLLLFAGYVNDGMTTPVLSGATGWALVDKVGGGSAVLVGGDTAASGVDAGPRGIAAWWKISDGSETDAGGASVATVTLTNGAGASRAIRAAMLRLPKDANTWQAPAAVVDDDTQSTQLNINSPSSLTVQEDDMLIAGAAWIPAGTNVSGAAGNALTLTGSGATTTTRNTGQAAFNFQVRLNTYTAPVASAATGAPALTLNFASDVAGPGIIIRARATGIPLRAVAGDAESVEPLGVITLDATASTGESVDAYEWSDAGGALVATTPTVQIQAPGTASDLVLTYRLRVHDASGWSGYSEVEKTVLASASVFVGGSPVWGVDVTR